MAQNNPKDLSALLGNRKALEQVAKSPDARTLVSMLAKDRDEAQLQKMAQSAMGGDTAALQSLVNSITATPEGAELLRRLSETFGGK